MKNTLYTLATLALFAVACTKPAVPQPKPQPEPEPEPEPEIVLVNTLMFNDPDGKPVKTVNMTATVGFVSDAGMYSVYSADLPVLTKEMIMNEFEFPAKSNVVALSTIFPLVGQDVDITKEALHWMMSVKVPGTCEYDLFEQNLEADIVGGTYRFDIDKTALKTTLKVELRFKDGSSMLCNVEGAYTPGGENESLFLWNDMSRPVRASFYDQTAVGAGNPPVMYLTNGQIDYGAEIPNTTYARITPSAAICDGQSHDIATEVKAGRLEFFLRDFDSEWNITSGAICIKHVSGYEYEVTVTGAEGEDINRKLADRSLTIVFKGEFKDVHIERPVPCQWIMGNDTREIKSCVVDLTSAVGAVYMCETAGISTVDAALADNPLIINFTASKFGSSIGLSMDRENFAVTYGADRWDASNLDTGSFICHEYNPTTGLFHCQLANICLKVTFKTVVKMEYKGTPVYIR